MTGDIAGGLAAPMASGAGWQRRMGMGLGLRAVLIVNVRLASLLAVRIVGRAVVTPVGAAVERGWFGWMFSGMMRVVAETDL